MTSREEIERLLNQTGRTLEGLPELYPEEQAQALYLEVAERRELWENIVLHQSDVIELLVGALKDALELKWISIKERLPADGQRVILINEKSPSITLQGIYKKDETPDTIRVLGFGIGKVTHWMPLPEPPIK